MLGMGLVSGGNKAVIWNEPKDEVRCCLGVHQPCVHPWPQLGHGQGGDRGAAARVGRVK